MVINSDHCDYRASYLLSLNGEAVLSRSFPVRWRSAGHVVFRRVGDEVGEGLSCPNIKGEPITSSRFLVG